MGRLIHLPMVSQLGNKLNEHIAAKERLASALTVLGHSFGSELGPCCSRPQGRSWPLIPQMSDLGFNTLFFNVSIFKMGLVITPI